MNQPCHFIVIDDDPSSSLICKMVIKKYLNALDTEIFPSAQLGLDFIKSTYPKSAKETKTVLFLDVNMPIFSGWEFLGEFAKFAEDIKSQFQIYILSSSIDNRDIAQAKNSGLVAGYFVKPLTKDKVLEVFG